MAMSIDVLYQDLLDDLGLTRCSLHWEPWDSPSKVAKVELAKAFTKKYHERRANASADQAALDKFLAVNERCGTWQPVAETLLDEMLLNHFRKEVWQFFKGNSVDGFVPDSYDVFEKARCGPGASIGVRIQSFYHKMWDSDLTHTAGDLLPLYADHLGRNSSWASAEQKRRELRGEPRCVAGNKLSFVPKNAQTSRSICTEPVLNMFYQLGFGELINDRLYEVFGYDPAVQPSINRRLAASGSQNRDKCTIDLSSASDSISMRMLQWCLPEDVLLWMDILRSPVSRLPDGREVTLNMVSTMGNGFTFPLQTALFSCAVKACFDVDDHQWLRRWRLPLFESEWDGQAVTKRSLWSTPNWAVFGDDIIVPERVSAKVCRLLQLLGFEINHDKSYFGSSPFRESCGHDAFNGFMVRGVYVKYLRETQDRISLLNRLLDWVRHHGVPLPRTVARLLRSVPKFVVPPWENEEAGIRMPYSVVRRLPWAAGIGSNSRGFHYLRWVSRPATLRMVECGEVLMWEGEKPSPVNGDGAYLSFLGGYISSPTSSVKKPPCNSGETHTTHRTGVDGGWVVRLKPEFVRYARRRTTCPDWDGSYGERRHCTDVGAAEEAVLQSLAGLRKKA